MSGQTDVPITAGSGTKIDGTTTATAGNIRQVVTLGDPLVDANVADVTAANALKVDNSAVTQPVSASALPLPTGAALDASLSTIDTDLKSNVTLHAGTNLIGKVGIDQTTPGTTNGVTVTDGTNTANVLKSDGTAAGQNAQLVAGTGLSVAYTTTSVANLASTDALNYPWVSVYQATTGGSSTTTFQTSNDNSNWVSQTLIQSTSIGGNPTSTAGNGLLYQGAVAGRYFRLAITGIISGTTAGTVVFSSMPKQLNSTAIAASQSGSWTVGSANATGSAVPANAYPQGLLAKTSSPAAATTGNLVGMLGDVMGMPQVATGGLVTTAVAVSASNTVVKATAGRLCNILVTTLGATAMIVYDNASTNSGTIIGQLPASAAVGSIYSFNMPAANGITVAGSATNPAVTISWV